MSANDEDTAPESWYAPLWALVEQWERDAAEARDASGYDDETTSADTEEAESAGAAEALAGAARDLRAALTGKPEDSEAVEEEEPAERRERYVRVKEVAERTGLTRQAVAHAIRQGRLPATRVGRVWLIPRTELERIDIAGRRERCPGCGLDVELDWTRIIPPHDTPAPGLCDAAGVRMPEVTT